jgi:Tol biopolymer transport system component
MRDDQGLAQLWTVSPRGGDPIQVTRHSWPVASAFSWSPDGRHVAHVMDRSVCQTEVATGITTRLTAPVDEESSPRPEACVFSPDGRRIAYVRRMRDGAGESNQIFVVDAS